GQDIVAFFQVRKGLAVLHVRAEASNASEDRLPLVRRQSDFAREGQGARRPFRNGVVKRKGLRGSGPLWRPAVRLFLALVRLGHLYLLAKLQIGTKAAAAQRDFKAGPRVFAQHLFALNYIGVGRDLPREIAFRIVRTADEGSKPSGLQRKLAGAALRALAARLAIGAFREDMWFEQI